MVEHIRPCVATHNRTQRIWVGRLPPRSLARIRNRPYNLRIVGEDEGRVATRIDSVVSGFPRWGPINRLVDRTSRGGANSAIHPTATQAKRASSQTDRWKKYEPPDCWERTSCKADHGVVSRVVGPSLPLQRHVQAKQVVPFHSLIMQSAVPWDWCRQ